MSITLQTEGRRTYLAGDTYPHRDAIRNIGAHWDAARKMWWTAKREQAETLAAQLNQTQPAAQSQSSGSKTPRDGLDSVVAGRVEYKGRTYYLAGRVDQYDTVLAVHTHDGAKVLLYFRDGSSQFWAAIDQVSLIKSYDRPQTIRGLKEFAAQIKEAGGYENYQADNGWRGNGCSECRRLGDWCPSCAFDEFDN